MQQQNMINGGEFIVRLCCQKKIDKIKLKAATAAWKKQTAAMKNRIMSHEHGHRTNILIVHADDM